MHSQHEPGANPYTLCPVLETEHFTLRLVREEDAQDLMACYGDPKAQPLFNDDNCDSGFDMDCVENMEGMIRFWLQAYASHAFVRFSIVDKETERAVGTMEVFGAEDTFGVIRLDIAPDYEKEPYLTELLALTPKEFFLWFPAPRFVTKAIPEAASRRRSLESVGFAPYDIPGRTYYYAMEKPA